MSLFQFGFTTSRHQEESPGASYSVQDYLPQGSECGLGIEEHSSVTSFVSDLASPEPALKKRKTKGTYTHYSNDDRAKIGQYANDHEKENARKKSAKYTQT